MASILQVQNLQVAYVSRAGVTSCAVVDVSFDVRRGEILGILGESASGKSTLAMSLLQLLPANAKIQSGQILLEGKDVLRLKSKELQKVRGGQIALVFQEPLTALHPTIRIGDQIGEVLRAHESMNGIARRARTRQVLAQVFLSDIERIADSYPHQLSGGQRQRVLVAQAIASRPLLLVADEPTASLDPTTQREILSLFKTLRQELGIAIILITHNPGLLVGFADRVLVLYAGRVVEWAPTEAVLFSPQHPYTKALLRCVPAFDGTKTPSRKTQLSVIDGTAPHGASLTEGCAFAPRCADRMDLCQARQPLSVALNETHRVSCFKFSRES
jgi:oligopeptide/dipeptide ABC transporter ATP-binding protein